MPKLFALHQQQVTANFGGTERFHSIERQNEIKLVECQLINATLIDSQLTFDTLINSPFD
jgi:hypothetical protein